MSKLHRIVGQRSIISSIPELFLVSLVSPPQNEDIDIALDNCTGVAFAEMVNVYLKSQGQDESKIGVIEVKLRGVNEGIKDDRRRNSGDALS